MGYNKDMELPSPLRLLLSPAGYPHAADSVRLIETHISWVLIAGEFAYKIKKPVNLGFLDFSTLAQRRHDCEEEVRLNRRLAPAIYLGVVPITAAGVESTGATLEWAVKMRAFPAEATLDKETAVTPAQIDAIADRLAVFHAEAARVPADSDYGRPDRVMEPVRENFRQIRACSSARPSAELLAELERWSEAEGQALSSHFCARRDAGFIRECHGDLHLGNIAWVEGQPLIFDCLEFNPNLRWIDVTNEVAFLFMDLLSRRRHDLAWRFLNRWLERSGDYAGLAGLAFYLVYRAMVRAKVAFIRAAQGDAGHLAEAQHYLGLAHALTRPCRPLLLLMHGLSGSGKTWFSQQLLETLGAIRLRSDVERKRLFGLAASADSHAIAGGIYSAEATGQTFRHLLELSAKLLTSRFTVIVDATFLRRTLRKDFLALANDRGVQARLISIQGDIALLRQRVQARTAAGRDASEADLAVLEAQIRQQDDLDSGERTLTLCVDARDASIPATLTAALNRACD